MIPAASVGLSSKLMSSQLQKATNGMVTCWMGGGVSSLGEPEYHNCVSVTLLQSCEFYWTVHIKADQTITFS